MIHARRDYDRIQDPAIDDKSLLSDGSTPIAADEPVFLVRASDQAFASTLRGWCSTHAFSGGDSRMIEAVKSHIKLAEKWQKKNGRKIADAPRSTMDN